MMPTHTPTDEQLRNQAITQALAGDTAGARRTAGGITDNRYLREVWQMMLFIESERGDVQAVKTTILACPDPALLASHFYLDLPQVFVKGGNISGAIEIAQAMGSYGVLPLIGMAAHLAEDGNFVGVQQALSHIEDENLRTMILSKVITCYAKRKQPEAMGQWVDQASPSDSLAA